MYYSPSGSFVRGILQARILDWVAISSYRGSSDRGIKLASLMSPALAGKQADFLPPPPPGIHKYVHFSPVFVPREQNLLLKVKSSSVVISHIYIAPICKII